MDPITLDPPVKFPPVPPAPSVAAPRVVTAPKSAAPSPAPADPSASPAAASPTPAPKPGGGRKLLVGVAAAASLAAGVAGVRYFGGATPDPSPADDGKAGRTALVGEDGKKSTNGKADPPSQQPDPAKTGSPFGAAKRPEQTTPTPAAGPVPALPPDPPADSGFGPTPRPGVDQQEFWDEVVQDAQWLRANGWRPGYTLQPTTPRYAQNPPRPATDAYGRPVAPALSGPGVQLPDLPPAPSTLVPAAGPAATTPTPAALPPLPDVVGGSKSPVAPPSPEFVSGGVGRPASPSDIPGPVSVAPSMAPPASVVPAVGEQPASPAQLPPSVAQAGAYSGPKGPVAPAADGPKLPALPAVPGSGSSGNQGDPAGAVPLQAAVPPAQVPQVPATPASLPPPSGTGTPSPAALPPPTGTTPATLPPVPAAVPAGGGGAPAPAPAAPTSLVPPTGPTAALPDMNPAKLPETPAVAPMAAPVEFTRPAAATEARPAPAAEKPPQTSFDEDVYEARAGDRYEAVSREFYGDAKFAAALQAYNRGRPLGPGVRVDVPPVHVLKKRFPQLAGGTTPVGARPGEWQAGGSADPFRPSRPRTYRAAADTTLRAVAQEALGDARRWQEIYDLNDGKYLPDRVPAGAELRLPAARPGE